MAVVAITSDDAVLADRERRLQTHRDRFLTDVEVAEAADQPKPVELPGLLLEPADEKHLPVERSEEHTSELQSLMRISYAVFCLKKKQEIPTSNNKHNNRQ